MFCDAESFNQPINFDVTSLTDTFSMFLNAKSFNQPINFDTSSLDDISYMFYGASSFDQNIENWDVSNCNEIDDDIFEKSKLKKDKKIPLWFYKNRVKR